MIDKITRNEFNLYIISGVLLAFLYTNFNTSIATGLVIMLITIIAIWLYDASFFNKIIKLKFSNSNKGWVSSLLIGVGIGVGFIFIVNAIMGQNYVQGTLQSVIFSSNPLFEKSIFLTILVWGGLVAFIETMFAVRGYEVASDSMNNNPLSLMSITSWALILIIGALALLFHSTAYNLNNRQLVTAFLFFSVSVVIAVIFKQAREAVIAHSTINTLAIINR